MNVRIVAVVFIFIARLKLPSSVSVIEVLRKRYGTDFVNNVIKLVNTAMSFQSFCNLIWQIETYDRLGLQYLPEKTVKRINQCREEKVQTVFVRT